MALISSGLSNTAPNDRRYAKTMSSTDQKLNLEQWPTADWPFAEGPERKNLNNQSFVIAYGLFHRTIVETMLEQCRATLEEYGVTPDRICLLPVPGSFELASAIACFHRQNPDAPIAAAIAIGCIIKGQTQHFDYVCQGTTQALAQLNTQGDFPVIFGVLTVGKLADALERSAPDKMNKGREFALTALWMANLGL